jgi:hypothetical protein
MLKKYGFFVKKINNKIKMLNVDSTNESINNHSTTNESVSKLKEKTSHVLYAYFKPKEIDSLYKVHITIDQKNKFFRVYYNITLVGEKDDNYLNLFKQLTTSVKKLNIKSKNKKQVRKKFHSIHSIKKRGSCFLDAKMFEDIFGSTFNSLTSEKIPGKIDFDINYHKKTINIIISINIHAIKDFTHKIKKLPCFSENPNTEIVKSNIHFFNMEWVTSRDV